jgi:hypothetical protein
VGSVRGEASCIQRLGDLALQRSDRDDAQERYGVALALYARLPDPWAMGMTRRRLARLATDPAERRRQLDAARASFTSVDRPDLIAELDAEFR